MNTKLLRWFSPVLTLPLAIPTAVIIYYTGGFGGAFSLLRLILAGTIAATIIALPFFLSRARALGSIALILLLTAVWWASHSPSADREWAEPASRTPWASIDGSVVTLHDVRDFRYDEDGGWEANWYDATYDLGEIEQSYFILTTFGDVAGVGHVMVSFRFAGERYIVLSVEIRREEGEIYDPIGGVFRQYELFYTAADERDALALRTHVHKDPTWVIPMNAGPQKTAAFFLDMVERMTRLHHEPEWYNTLTSSCATNLARHYERINDVRLPPDYRIILPGFSEELIAELDLLPDGVDVATAREKYLVDESLATQAVTQDYSQRIRPWQ